MSVAAEGIVHDEFHITATVEKSLVHPIHQALPEQGIVLRVEPKAGYPAPRAEVFECGHEHIVFATVFEAQPARYIDNANEILWAARG